jgi:hypothetical protein
MSKKIDYTLCIEPDDNELQKIEQALKQMLRGTDSAFHNQSNLCGQNLESSIYCSSKMIPLPWSIKYFLYLCRLFNVVRT